MLIQITAYLRDEEDLAKWKLLPNKAEFLHDALQGMPGDVPKTTEPSKREVSGPKIINTPEAVKKIFPDAKTLPVTTTSPIHTA